MKLGKSLVYAILCIIVVFGFVWRLHHVDYPVVGYHNWKEVHYLTEGRNFARDGFFAHGFFIPAWDYPGLQDNPNGAHGDTFPTISILASLGFKIFGMNLLIARLIGVLLSSASIVLFYILLWQLFRRQDIALVGAGLMAINPMLVFFARNVQLINPGLFFTLLGCVLFMHWVQTRKGIILVSSSASLTLGILTKYPYAVMLVPLAFVVPWKDVFSNFKTIQRKIPALIIPILLPLWFLYSKIMAKGSTSVRPEAFDPSALFTEVFDQSFKAYNVDNFTKLGLLFAALGIAAAVYMFIRHKRTGEWFLIGSLAGFIFFFPVMAAKISGHNYHYMYIAPLVLAFVAYFVVFAADKISSFTKGARHIVKIVLVLLLLFLLWTPSMEAKQRQFNVLFMGLDSAGEYVYEHKRPGERAMHSTHQAYGFLWHADVKGTRGIPQTVEEMKVAEEKLNASWIFLYEWDMPSVMNSPRWQYIQSNYILQQVGFIQRNEQRRNLYFLFQKGGSTNMSQLDNMMKNASMNKVTYKQKGGKKELFVAEW